MTSAFKNCNWSMISMCLPLSQHPIMNEIAHCRSFFSILGLYVECVWGSYIVFLVHKSLELLLFKSWCTWQPHLKRIIYIQIVTGCEILDFKLDTLTDMVAGLKNGIWWLWVISPLPHWMGMTWVMNEILQK